MRISFPLIGIFESFSLLDYLYRRKLQNHKERKIRERIETEKKKEEEKKKLKLQQKIQKQMEEEEKRRTEEEAEDSC